MRFCTSAQFFLRACFRFFPNRLKLGAILKVHKFFRRLAKPFVWFVHYTGFHLCIVALLEIADAATYQTSSGLHLALVTGDVLCCGLFLLTFVVPFAGHLLFHPGAAHRALDVDSVLQQHFCDRHDKAEL